MWSKNPGGEKLHELLRRANPCLVETIQAYVDETGETLEHCINEAIALWLECIAEPNLEAFRAPSKPKLKLVPPH
jgi:hypothetical protein